MASASKGQTIPIVTGAYPVHEALIIALPQVLLQLWMPLEEGVNAE